MIERKNVRRFARIISSCCILLLVLSVLMPPAYGMGESRHLCDMGGVSVIDGGGKAAGMDISTLSGKSYTGSRSVRELVPLGHTVGIKLLSDGVVIIALSDIITENGEISPAGECGLKKGDIITQINSEKIDSAGELQELLQSLGGGSVNIQARRGGSILKFSLTPVLSKSDGNYKIGIWVRDSMAGIGTLTFYDPESGVFGALGHGINDVDTSILMPLSSGTIMHSTITSIKKGEEGFPGQLQGVFNLNDNIGKLYANTSCGIFGVMGENELVRGRSAIPVGARKDVKVGPATILSNIYGDTVTEYDIEIVKVYPDSADTTRNMLIRITDQRLIDATGGIVQGMSGSPVIQNGKIIGAVTHVLINDPTKGYGIMIENMLNEAFWQAEKTA